MNRPLFFILLFLVSFCIYGCRKQTGLDTSEKIADHLKAAPDGFDYSTTKKIDINVRLLSISEKPIKNVMVSVYYPSDLSDGAELTKVLTDNDGYIKTSLSVPSYVDTLIIDPAYFGLTRNVKLYARNNSMTAIISGLSGASGNIVNEKGISFVAPKKNKLAAVKGVLNSATNTMFVYDPDEFDDLGRPKDANRYPKEIINWANLMTRIGNALPEKTLVKSKYIRTEAQSNLNITKLSDVWITFVHEGANYRNSFGYYTYPTGHPPRSEQEISTIHMIFPNASLASGIGKGSMQVGDKVKIGRFTPGTSIGFVLLQDAYNNKTINTSATKFYTNEDLNPETDTLKRHNVLLNNLVEETFIIGFEDVNRSPKQGSDQDFNDLVVYAQSNPVDAISPLDIPFLDENIEDRDGDGVRDDQDEYPDDKKRAYNRYYPSKLTWGTLAFEDLWPNEGDYDLNDLVISYRYKFAMSSSNAVVDMTAEYKPLAAGASKQNGFGLQLPIDPNAISNVSGYQHSSGYIKLNSNGTEADQAKAVVIPFDNYRGIFGGAKNFINTVKGSSAITGNLTTLSIEFTTPLPDDFTASAPFNPFMISDLNRGIEVHLIDNPPTSLADLNLLRTGADNSKPGEGKYYLTRTNKPFGLDIYGSFSYPFETIPITNAYLHFTEWAKSGGQTFKDWHNISKKGYVNDLLIFTKK